MLDVIISRPKVFTRPALYFTCRRLYAAFPAARPCAIRTLIEDHGGPHHSIPCDDSRALPHGIRRAYDIQPIRWCKVDLWPTTRYHITEYTICGGGHYDSSHVDFYCSSPICRMIGISRAHSPTPFRSAINFHKASILPAGSTILFTVAVTTKNMLGALQVMNDPTSYVDDIDLIIDVQRQDGCLTSVYSGSYEIHGLTRGLWDRYMRCNRSCDDDIAYLVCMQADNIMRYMAAAGFDTSKYLGADLVAALESLFYARKGQKTSYRSAILASTRGPRYSLESNSVAHR